MSDDHPKHCEGTRVECPPPEGSTFQTVSRAVLNLQEFVVREVRTNLEWASMSPRALGLIVGGGGRSTDHQPSTARMKIPGPRHSKEKWSTVEPTSPRNPAIPSTRSMHNSPMSQSDRRGRRLGQTSQLPTPSLLSAKPSLYPSRTAEPLPTITTLNASPSRYPTRNSISSVQKPVPVIEDELHSESDSQLANTKQESGTTSDFVKKLFKCVFEFELESSHV